LAHFAAELRGVQVTTTAPPVSLEAAGRRGDPPVPHPRRCGEERVSMKTTQIMATVALMIAPVIRGRGVFAFAL
jgi:hypothetical protein